MCIVTSRAPEYMRSRLESSPACDVCARLRSQMRHTCDAFPEMIPHEVWDGDVIHIEPYEGDQGIQFELRSGRIPFPVMPILLARVRKPL